MKIGSWQFSPGLVPSIITLLLLPLLVALGAWQLDRAEQKREIYQEFINRQKQMPVNLNTENIIRNNKEDLMWRHVKVTGEFSAGVNILLDNQVMNGMPGYFVFTPFRLANENVMVLVNRGWIAGSGNRNEIQDIETPAGIVDLIAVAKDVPATGILLGQATIEPVATGVYRVQIINMNEMKNFIHQDLLPYILRLEPDSNYGFMRQWQAVGSGEERHLGYAFQWFAMSVTLLVIYIVVNARKVA